MSSTNVIVINLDKDVERYARLSAALAGQGLVPLRLPGVLGSALPRSAMAFVPGERARQMGTFGCFLSHVRAWETLIDAQMDSAIILEDDATLCGDLEQAGFEARASGAEVVFVNNRMTPPADVEEAMPGKEPWISLCDAILARATLNQIACGGDGYFLTRSGAEALLDLVRQQGVYGDVDWMILFAALGKDTLPLVSANVTFLRKLRDMGKVYPLGPPALTGAVLRRPAVRHGRSQSSRLQQNQIGT